MQDLANTRGNAADDSTAPLPWSRRSRDLAMVLWSSFIAAALATVTCFASLDPLEVVGQVGTADPVTSKAARMTGYALGFFFFWIIAGISSWITLYLVRTDSDSS
jgi:hypothetical protein